MGRSTIQWDHPVGGEIRQNGPGKEDPRGGLTGYPVISNSKGKTSHSHIHVVVLNTCHLQSMDTTYAFSGL